MAKKKIIETEHKYKENKELLTDINLNPDKINKCVAIVEKYFIDGNYDHLGTNYFEPLFIHNGYEIKFKIIPRTKPKDCALYCIFCTTYKPIEKVEPLIINNYQLYDVNQNKLYKKIITKTQATISEKDCRLIFKQILNSSKLIKEVLEGTEWQHCYGGMSFPVIIKKSKMRTDRK